MIKLTNLTNLTNNLLTLLTTYLLLYQTNLINAEVLVDTHTLNDAMGKYK